ncbi:MAG: endolytic transglycosylase MltG [Firmicutes bacterium]|nr:endolytic transglycosylase MltG [Bacillota bacterium]
MGRQRGWRVRKRFWVGAALIAAALFLVGYVSWLFQPVNSHSRVVRYFRVSSGQSADQVAASLKEAGIIRSALAFEVLSRWDHLATHLTAGVYRLSPRDSLRRILDTMRRGDVVTIKVAIPEGFTVQEVVSRLVHAHIGTAVQYQALERSPLPGMPVPAAGVRDALEGYLFPATYQFPYGTTPRQALMTMWETFQSRVVQGVYDHAHTTLTLSQWVTLASIVQAEDEKGSQASEVAAVFMNRLSAHMPFQSDATVRYAMGHPVAGGLSIGDLSYRSPYNTYLHAGIPPGPIDNPGLAMLKAALHPAHVPYLYFLSLRSGTMLFATTYQQHLANIAYANSHPNS